MVGIGDEVGLTDRVKDGECVGDGDPAETVGLVVDTGPGVVRNDGVGLIDRVEVGEFVGVGWLVIGMEETGEEVELWEESVGTSVEAKGLVVGIEVSVGLGLLEGTMVVTGQPALGQAIV